ncbi:MAG TPA: hypothetical protein VGC91_07875 [Pyrinomonadaceae bacterium]|jgi:hypothetical protein
MLPKPHTLLKSIWRTPVLKRRLMKFFGCKKTHFYALLKGLRKSLIERYCELVEEAWKVDPTGKQALRLAEYPRRHYRQLVKEQAALDSEWDNHLAANDLLREAAEAISKLNSLDMRSLDRTALEETRTELLDVAQVTRMYLSRIDVRLHALGGVRPKLTAMRTDLRFSISGAGGHR